MKVVLVGAGECAKGKLSTLLSSRDFDSLIAVDGGYRVCRELGYIPDLAIGDFDSLGFIPDDCPVLVFPVMKDESDLELALDRLLGEGFDEAILFGFTGGRLDHGLSALQVCAGAAEKGLGLSLVADDCLISYLVGPGVLELPAREEGTVSLLAMDGGVCGLSIEGLLYTAEGIDLSPRSSRGLSNEFCGTSARISLDAGTLLIISQV